MKVLVEQKEFLDKASNLTNFIDKKDDLLTSNFYIQATQNTLIVKATNLKIGLSIKIDSVIVEEEGIILVNGVELLKVIKKDGIALSVQVGNRHLYDLLNELNLLAVFNVRQI